MEEKRKTFYYYMLWKRKGARVCAETTNFYNLHTYNLLEKCVVTLKKRGIFPACQYNE